MPPRKLYTASDIRSYARCPRQWWYETRSAELARLSAEEVERRLAALRRRHGTRAEDLAAYQLLADLAARHERLARGRASHATHARQALRPRVGCLPTLLGLIVLLLWKMTEEPLQRH